MNSRDVLFEGSKNLSSIEYYIGELSRLGSLLESSDDGRRVLKHFECCKSTVYIKKNDYVRRAYSSVCQFSDFLPGILDVGTVFDMGADISVICLFFNLFVAGLYISFDKSKNVLCFPGDIIYVGSPV